MAVKASATVTLARVNDGEDGKGAANGIQLTNQDLNNYKNNDQCGYYFAGGGNQVKNKPSGVDAFGMWLLRVASGYYQQERGWKRARTV